MLEKYLTQLQLPKNDSHKGQNGKLLLIGGSELFHAASKWSLDVASKIVDMVFYSSVTSNNELLQSAKSEFWNGIVVARVDLEEYVTEADCVLIGPGMERNEETKELINTLLKKYPKKKFVIDAGALQMVTPILLNSNHIITPHTKEMSDLKKRMSEQNISFDDLQTTVLLKGKEDLVTWFESEGERVEGKSRTQSEELAKINQDSKTQPNKISLQIPGGNEGMTKGGTGDVLAGLVAALYCTNQAHISAIVGSYVNKKAGDELYKSVGPFFNASDLVEQVPKTLWYNLQNEKKIKSRRTRNIQ